MPALNTAVAGLRSLQQEIDTIANNIANVDTVAFKASRTTFSDSFYQTLRASSDQEPIGVQIGSGVQTQTINTVQSQGSFQQTGNTTDLAISGGGFFALQDSSGNEVFSRAGNFTLNQTGDLINSLGMHVRGIMGNASSDTGDATDPGTASPASLTDVVIPSSFVSQAAAVAASATVTVGSSVLPNVGDHLVVGSVTFTFIANGGTPAANTGTSGQIALGTNASTTATAIATAINNHTALEAASGVSASTSGNVITLTANTTGTGGNLIPVTTTSAATSLAVPAGGTLSGGVALGSLRTESVTSYNIGLDGKISLFGSAGTTRIIAYIPIAKFSNPEAMTQIGNNLYSFSSAAGSFSGSTSFSETADMRKAGTNGFGQVQSGALELSNVDLSQEFSEMIVTQRGFEANAKVITTSDQLLQTVVNLKQ